MSTLPADRASSRTSPWLFIGIGAGAVTALSLIGTIERGAQVKKCEDAEPMETCLELDAVRSQRTGWAVSTVVFGLATIGSFVLFAMDRSDSGESATASCTPGLTGGSCTVKF